MRSAATSEFDEEFGQSEQTGFEDDADDANDEDLDNRKGNRKVFTSLLLILTIQNDRLNLKHAPTRRDVAWRSEVRSYYIIKGMSHSTIIRCLSGSCPTVIAQPFLQKVVATGIIR